MAEQWTCLKCGEPHQRIGARSLCEKCYPNPTPKLTAEERNKQIVKASMDYIDEKVAAATRHAFEEAGEKSVEMSRNAFGPYNKTYRKACADFRVWCRTRALAKEQGK